GCEHQQEEHHDVDDAFGEDGADRCRERHRGVELEQIGAIRVAELGRHDAVGKPAEEDDLRQRGNALTSAALFVRVQLDVVEQPSPAQRSNRKRGVERDEREQQQGRIGLTHPVQDGAHVDLHPGEQERQDGEAQRERQQRAQVEEAPSKCRRRRLFDFDRGALWLRFFERAAQGHSATALSIRVPTRSAATRPSPSSTPSWTFTLCTNRLSNRLWTQNTTNPPKTPASSARQKSLRAASERTRAPPSWTKLSPSSQTSTAPPTTPSSATMLR